MKQAYQKPEITQVMLNPEEATLSACKSTAWLLLNCFGRSQRCFDYFISCHANGS